MLHYLRYTEFQVVIVVIAVILVPVFIMTPSDFCKVVVPRVYNIKNTVSAIAARSEDHSQLATFLENLPHLLIEVGKNMNNQIQDPTLSQRFQEFCDVSVFSWYFTAIYIGLSLLLIHFISQGPVAEIVKNRKKCIANSKKSLKNRDCFGLSCVVTGANAGIGFFTAKHLAAMGFRVIMICRDEKRGNEAKQTLLNDDHDADIRLVLGDVSDFDSLKKVAQDIIREATTNSNAFCLLVNNAGLFSPSKKFAPKTGIDLILQTNYLGPYLLTEYLRPHLSAAPATHKYFAEFSRPRVVNVSSIAHLWLVPSTCPEKLLSQYQNGSSSAVGNAKTITATKSLAILLQQELPSVNCYGISKICNIFHARNLCKRNANDVSSSVLDKSNNARNTNLPSILTASVHPGSVHSEIWRWAPAKFFFDILMAIFFKTSEQGAMTTLHACFDNNYKSGSYFTDCCDIPPSAWASDEKEADEVEKWTRKTLTKWL